MGNIFDLNNHKNGCWPARLPLLALIWLLVFLGTAGVAAQRPSTSGKLVGKLTDSYSVPLEKATIVLRNLATGAAVSSTTASNGAYRFDNLGPGEYRLEATLSGLGKAAVEGILISAGHATRVQAALNLKRPDPINLIATNKTDLDPVNPAVTSTIAGEELNQIPIATRDWQGFEALMPAANPVTAQLEDDGLDGETENAQTDSGSAMATQPNTSQSIDGFTTTPGFHAGSSHSDLHFELPGESAVETIEATSGGNQASAESGPSIRVTTAKGASSLHGQVKYRNRQSFWAAQNPFTQRFLEVSPASSTQIAQFAENPYTPADTRQSLGISLGSSTKSKRFGWFSSFDGLLRNDPAIATVRHPAEFFARPTDPELQILSARLGLPSSAPIEEGVAAYSTGLEQLASLLGPVPRSTTQAQAFGRIDWQLNERQSVTFDTNLANFNAPAGALSRTSQTYSSHSFGNSRAQELWASLNLDSFLTANLLNSFAAQYRSHLQSETAQAPSAFEQPLIANPWGQLPEIIADSTYGFILGKPARLGNPHSQNPKEDSYAVEESLSWVLGQHLLKFGGSLDHITDEVNTLTNQTGTYSYADILNLISDTASFEQYGFTQIANGQSGQHNCDQTGKIHIVAGVPTGSGDLPCYAWYTQRIGPSKWRLSTNDIALYLTEQWQPLSQLTLSVGIRAQSQQLPSPIANIENPDLPATTHFPAASFLYGPRFGLAWAPFHAASNLSTVLRVGAGLYYGRIDNSTVLAVLSQTGSPNSDLNFFFKPTDQGAPPFPYVFPVQPQTVVAPGAVSFASNFHRQQIDQAIFSVEQSLPSHWLISVNAMASLGRHLPISIDTNLSQPINFTNNLPETIQYTVVDTLKAGPIKSPTITVPFYAVDSANPGLENARLNPRYQQLASIDSRANSTYDAAMIKITRSGAHGLGFRAHYVYAHATDFNPNESSHVASNDVLDPNHFAQEYGTSNLDIRHSAAFTLIYQTPWKLQSLSGYLFNGWSIATVGQYRSGLPYTIRTSGYIPSYYVPLLSGGNALIEGVATGINGSGGDNRIPTLGRNTYRYPATYTGDARISKRFNLGRQLGNPSTTMRQIEFLAESFNLFNHQNVTQIETTGYTIDRGATDGSDPTLNFLTGLNSKGVRSLTTVEFGKPLDVNATNFYHPRQFQFGLQLRF